MGFILVEQTQTSVEHTKFSLLYFVDHNQTMLVEHNHTMPVEHTNVTPAFTHPNKLQRIFKASFLLCMPHCVVMAWSFTVFTFHSHFPAGQAAEITGGCLLLLLWTCNFVPFQSQSNFSAYLTLTVLARNKCSSGGSGNGCNSILMENNYCVCMQFSVFAKCLVCAQLHWVLLQLHGHAHVPQGCGPQFETHVQIVSWGHISSFLLEHLNAILTQIYLIWYTEPQGFKTIVRNFFEFLKKRLIFEVLSMKAVFKKKLAVRLLSSQSSKSSRTVLNDKKL